MIPAVVVITLSSLTSSALIYNVEARMYSLGALCVLAAYLAFYQIYRQNRVFDWYIFGFTFLCAAYTHYYALISVAFFYLMLLPLWRKGAAFRKRIIRLYAVTVLSYIVWLYVLYRAFRRTILPPFRSAGIFFGDSGGWRSLHLYLLSVMQVFRCFTPIRERHSPTKTSCSLLDCSR